MTLSIASVCATKLANQQAFLYYIGSFCQLNLMAHQRCTAAFVPGTTAIRLQFKVWNEVFQGSKLILALYEKAQAPDENNSVFQGSYLVAIALQLRLDN